MYALQAGSRCVSSRPHQRLRGAFVRPVNAVRTLSVFQEVTSSLVSLHEISGLPWLALVPLITFGLRTAFTLPLSVWQRKRIVKQQELRKVVQATTPVVKLRLAASTQANSKSAKAFEEEEGNVATTLQKPSLSPDQITLLALKETRSRQKKMFGESKVQLWKNALLPLVQIPLWVSVSMGLRELTKQRLVDSNLTHANPLQNIDSLDYVSRISSLDLSLPLDGLPILAPLLLGTLALLNVEHNGRVMTTTTSETMGIKLAPNPSSKVSQSMQSILNVSRLSCIFFMGVSSQAPLLLSAYWISSQLYSLVQNLLLDWLWPYQR
ncbi:membrane insertase COX18 [Lachancea thermotolerans CBS 6340]|uniref:KLTH0D13376p n=1 Tax=Lachancea thermotolerans (strain ATCC 56472 / CBS 6340 / NRRL Y-8284) TaxID=559295 RepID=C5DF98_LACTC|nr:KLTH0D13376p [Lachancea thermotolerans CBS 6340]CAR22853.1 KLTH0D13376p [Lachancea thermotolerans CBS 6340]